MEHFLLDNPVRPSIYDVTSTPLQYTAKLTDAGATHSQTTATSAFLFFVPGCCLLTRNQHELGRPKSRRLSRRHAE